MLGLQKCLLEDVQTLNRCFIRLRRRGDEESVQGDAEQHKQKEESGFI